MKSITEPTNYGYSSVDYSQLEFTIENILILVKNRWKFETMEVNDIRIIYMDLDKLISQCAFGKTQLKVLSMAMSGWTHEDIAVKMNWYLDRKTRDGKHVYYANKNKSKSAIQSLCKDIFLQHQSNLTYFNYINEHRCK